MRGVYSSAGYNRVRGICANLRYYRFEHVGMQIHVALGLLTETTEALNSCNCVEVPYVLIFFCLYCTIIPENIL